MWRRFMLMFAIGSFVAAPLQAQTNEPLVPEDAKLEKLGEGYGWAEGPAAGPEGMVYFTDTRKQTIHRFNPDTRKITTYAENTGGANGLACDRAGRLYRCEGDTHELTRAARTGDAIEVLADQYQGRSLNGPNDLVLDKHGGVYFTDPRYGNRDTQPIEVEGVYYWHPEKGLSRVIGEGVARPNGIGLSPDGETLYVSDDANRALTACPVKSPGRVGEVKSLAQIPRPDGGVDGMSVDTQGRLYVAGTDGVWVYDETGQQQAHIKTPKFATNCTLEDGYLYITAKDMFYRIAVNAESLPLTK